MWFRVELNKDGTAASCEQVAASLENGKTVRYVEADSKESALRIVAAWRRQLERINANSKRYTTECKKRGICTQCRRVPSANGRALCPACLTYQRNYDKDRRSGALVPKPLRTEEERAARFEASKKRRQENARERYGSPFVLGKAVGRRDTLREVLTRFDACNAVVFRAWLEAETNAATEARPRAKRRPWRDGQEVAAAE